MAGSYVRRLAGQQTWEGVEVLRYKPEGSAPFRDVTRQVLFSDPGLDCELRYFEVQPAGYSTLERHEHVHAVLILRGRGRCLVGTEIFEVAPHDLVSVPPLTWHQFRAAPDAPMGFLCMVNARRDRPQLPGEEDLQRLRADPRLAAFIAV
jgi:quercetin dioxygenase-like cupin family protein